MQHRWFMALRAVSSWRGRLWSSVCEFLEKGLKCGNALTDVMWFQVRALALVKCFNHLPSNICRSVTKILLQRLGWQKEPLLCLITISCVKEPQTGLQEAGCENRVPWHSRGREGFQIPSGAENPPLILLSIIRPPAVGMDAGGLWPTQEKSEFWAFDLCMNKPLSKCYMYHTCLLLENFDKGEQKLSK